MHIVEHWCMYSTVHYSIDVVSGCVPVPVPVPVILNVDVISKCYTVLVFRNVVHTCSLEPGETPSYSASHHAPIYATFLNIAKHS